STAWNNECSRAGSEPGLADPPPPGPSGITITRVFDAPRARVWREWTDPASFADWFGGPTCEVPMSTVSMDVRPGGAWRLTMLCESGSLEIHWKGEDIDVVEAARL